MDQIGGPQDSTNLNESMNELIHRCNGISKKTNTMLKQLVTVSNNFVRQEHHFGLFKRDIQRQYRLPRERLTNEYMAALNRLQAAQRKAVVKEKAKIKTVTVQDEQLSAQQVPHEDNQRRIQLQEQHRININELRERQQVVAQTVLSLEAVGFRHCNSWSRT